MIDLISALATGDAQWPEHFDSADEEQFLRLATTHGMGPLLDRALRGRRVPEQVALALREQARELVAVETVRLRELDGVLARLAAADVPTLLIKGAAVAAAHYPHPALRPRCDADVLIRRQDFPRAQRVLAGAGYEQSLTAGGTRVRAQRTWTRIDRYGIANAIDLHWSVSNRARFARVLSFDELWSRSAQRGSDPRTRAVIGPDALLLACVHLAGHHPSEERLIWLYDLHLLATELGPESLEELIVKAERKQTGHAVRAALLRARELFGTPLPPALVAPLPPTSRETLFAHVLSDLRWSRGWRDRFAVAREHLFPAADYMLMKYGRRSRALLPILYLRRVVETCVRAAAK